MQVLQSMHAFGSDYVMPLGFGGRAPFAVRGLIVGRFMVRSRVANETGRDVTSNARVTPRDWNVMHINSGITWSFSELAVALAVADDMSRFSRTDPSTRKLVADALRKQMGELVWSWVEEQQVTDAYVPFRQWRDGGLCTGAR
jgi:hypothetical protein